MLFYFALLAVFCHCLLLGLTYNLFMKKVLVAVSGGPDSMALLDMVKDKYEVYVAHVNYHHRDSAKRDEDIVREYCLNFNIPFYVKDYVECDCGNFQENARVFRYGFFKELIDKYNLECVLTAHHKDDLIETYLMQIKRDSHVYYYGLKRSVKVFGIKIVRPLLKYSKTDLRKYCDDHLLKYGIDESNLGDDYTRNKIRHEVVEKMSDADKKEIIKKINALNKENNLNNKKCKAFINKRNKILVDEFLNYPDSLRLLRMFLGISVSRKQGEDILRQIKTAKQFDILIEDRYLCKEYGYLLVYLKEDDYCYVLDDLSYFKTKHFKLSSKGNSFEAVCIKKDDFPLTIRNYKEGDSIKMAYGHKKLNRFFIDNKISHKDRKMWPVLLNRTGSAILVPKIGCDINHYCTNASIYMIKLES